MSVRRSVTVAAELLAVLMMLSLVIGQALSTPVGLSYVETGSMDPTLSPGDGFAPTTPNSRSFRTETPSANR